MSGKNLESAILRKKIVDGVGGVLQSTARQENYKLIGLGLFGSDEELPPGLICFLRE